VIGQVAGPAADRPLHDPLDVQLDRLRPTPADGVAGPRPSERHAWSTDVQVAVLLIAGVALGRHGLGILSDSTLSLVDPVVPVALAALGVLAAFEIGTTPWLRTRALAATTVHSLAAAALVAAGTLAFIDATAGSASLDPWVIAVALGVCASTSSALGTGDPAARSTAARIVDLDAVLAIAGGGVAIVFLREHELLSTLSMTAQLVGIAAVVAIAGWLLLSRSSSDTEQRVFAAATLLLLGGIADYLSLSALMAGLVAGALWHTTGGAARESMRRALAHVQHPLVALILLVAGARTDFTAEILGLTVAYVLLRGVAKLAGSLAAPIAPAAPGEVARRLLWPGILGIAFALNALRAAGPEMTAVLSIAVLGTIGSQLLAGASRPEDAS
jgi:hypothetical protein